MSQSHYTIDFITHAPAISNEKYTKEILLQEYGITACKIQPLTGYDDLNFLLESCEVTTECHPELKKLIKQGERKFILKFTNPVEAAAHGLIDSQIKLMEVLLENDIPCAITIPQKDGKKWKNIDTEGNIKLPVRLFSFLPGQMLEDFESKHACNTYNLIGNLLAKFHWVCKKKLTPLINKNGKSVVSPFYHFYPFFSLENWDVMENEFHLLQSDYLHFFDGTDKTISVEEKLALCSTIFQDFKESVLSCKNQMIQGIIHSDFNETNILLIKDSISKEDKISGLLDFGDTHHSLLIYDIANTILYLFLDYEKTMHNSEKDNCLPRSDKLKEQLEVIAKYVLEGYKNGLLSGTANEYKQNFMELELLDLGFELEVELDLIGICMKARLVLSLVYGLRTLRINHRKSDCTDYFMKTQENGWKVLKLLSKMDLISMFRCDEMILE